LGSIVDLLYELRDNIASAKALGYDTQLEQSSYFTGDFFRQAIVQVRARCHLANAHGCECSGSF
jgi:hypothetical protein